LQRREYQGKRRGVKFVKTFVRNACVLDLVTIRSCRDCHNKTLV